MDLSVKRLYGRRKGRPLSSDRQNALETLLPKLEIPLLDLPCNHSVSIDTLFPKSDYKENWLEIGFGDGKHLSSLMQHYPHINYLGAEPFVNGMSYFLFDISEMQNDNIRVLMNDGMMIAESLRPHSLDGIYILNPDPWHKKRHHKRRLVRRENLDHFAAILKPGGKLVVTTDVDYLAEWMLAHVLNHGAFEWSARQAKDWHTPPENWIPTRYELKGAKGAKKMIYMLFEKKRDEKNLA